MFRFAHEDMLYGLLIIPFLVLLFVLAVVSRKRARKKYADPTLHSVLIPDLSTFRYLLKFLLVAGALALFIFSLAGPRVGSKLREVEKTGRELIFALDVSNSMLAEDLKPNRLEVAKMALNNLLGKLENDKVGLIVFAGDAYVQIPITTDYAAARLFLNSVTTDMVSKQGTAIGSAINLAVKSFTPDVNSENPGEGESAGSKAIIIITDGEDHEKGVFESAEKAAEKGIVIHTIGLGDPKGVPIPLNQGSNNFLRDKDGNVVVSKLDETTLKRIAATAEGYYINAGSHGGGVSQLTNKLDEMRSEKYKTKIFAEYAERYQYFLALGLLLLLIETLLLERKNKWLNRIKLFN